MVTQEIILTREQINWVAGVLASLASHHLTIAWNVDHIIQKRFLENVDLKIQIYQDFDQEPNDFQIIVWE